ncbi:MAG: AAA family ATPase [Spirochaetia bacterium]|jgi:chromosome segregation protein|nr:AAA family ATPase [Spirochaetia bacterium]
MLPSDFISIKTGFFVFLKSLELFGFKSFADRSRIEFADGISALLGPNGCGKSNVVDAIKWVLGEQATKSLRADKMEDVIFNGTETRKPLNVAEVALTLANESGFLPMDFPEVVIKRRLYRSGESEYYINDTLVRLKEVRELFYDTGIGRSAYSIMEQGKIDQILSNKPEERRMIFEEAAAITKCRVKSQEAERKLEKAEENMRQVEGIIAEVKRSHDSLKVQCEKTLRHRELREECFGLDRDVQLLRLRGFLEAQEEKKTALAGKTARRDGIKKEIDGLNEFLEKNLDSVNAMESRFSENQNRIYEFGLEKQSLERQDRMLAERLSDFEAKIAADEAREKSIQEKIAGLLQESGQGKKALEEAKARIAEIDGNIAAFEESVRASGERMLENQKAIQALEGEIHRLEEQDETLRGDLRGITDTIVEELDRRLKESGYSSQEKSRLEEELDTSLEAVRIQLEGKSRVLEDALAVGDAAEYEKLLRAALESLRGLREKIGAFGEKLALFKKQSPSFIDEFLAPQGIITRKREIDERIAEARAQVRENRQAIAGLRAENTSLSQKVDEYRKTLEELRLGRERLRAQAAGVEENIARLRQEEEAQKKLLRETAEDISRSRQRIADINLEKEGIGHKRQALEQSEEKTRKELEGLKASISERQEEYAAKEKKLKARMEDLGKTQESVDKTQLDLNTTAIEIRSIYENFLERHSRDLTEFESRIYEITKPAKELRDRLAELREEERKLAPVVNYMAPEQFAAVKERYDFLVNQLEDAKKAKEYLQQVAQQARDESTTLFLSTFQKIRSNFHLMFRRLFGGGRAEIRLSDSEKVLESGIEILAQPPGKNLESIALLSGGERSLTAVALLFATYMVRPSPFCLLDEMDAALDESNVGRFVAMLMEFGTKSQFVVITHNKKTMTGAKTLLGVTMQESGVSTIVSIRADGPPEKEPGKEAGKEIEEPEETEKQNA